MIILPYLIVLFGVTNLIRMGVFLVGSDIYELRHFRNMRKKRNMKHGSYPFYTVVIPAHNEQSAVLRAVQSVLQNDYPKNKLQVVVVDDGSTDETKKILQDFQKTNKVRNLKLVFQKNQGKAKALNNGIRKHAKGKLVMCLDADSYIDTYALKKASRYFRDERVMALSANVRIHPTKTFFNLLQRFEYIVCYQMKRAQSVFNIEYIIGGIGSSFRREFIEKVGYYDGDTITEDIDLTMKILQRGNRNHRVIYGSDVIAHTESVMSISDLMKQRFRWKWGRTQTFFKNKKMFFNSDKKFTKWLTWVYLPYAIFTDIAFFFEPIMIAYILYIVFMYNDFITLLSAILVVSLYLCANLLMESTLSIKERIKLLPFVPGMYFCFYVLSYVEYFALIKMLVNLPKLKDSIERRICSWAHVQRQAVS